MAPAQASSGQPTATNSTMYLQRLHGVGRAGGVETATRPEHRREQQLVAADQQHQNCLHDPVPAGRARGGDSTRSNIRSRSAASTSDVAAALAGVARSTASAPSGSRLTRADATARSRRLTPVRVTAVPTALETTMPTSAGPSVAAPWGASSKCTARWVLPARRPRRTANEKSSLRRIRCAAGSTPAPSGREFGAALAATRTENGAPGPGAHAQPKAVCLGATPVVRLEGALAH